MVRYITVSRLFSLDYLVKHGYSFNTEADKAALNTNNELQRNDKHGRKTFQQITLALKMQAPLKAKLVSTHYWSDIVD